MRKLTVGLTVGLLVVGLLAMVAGPAMAQFGDPLNLATSGVLIPFVGAGSNISILEVASPVGNNPLLHFVFYNAACVRTESFPTAETVNGVTLYNVPAIVPGIDGLVAIGDDNGNGVDLTTLTNGIHTRMYWINASTSTFRVLEPITLNTEAEGLFGPGLDWNPIRTGATFLAPRESPGGLQTTLYLICPTTTIQSTSTSATDASAFAIGRGFPAVTAFGGPAFKSAYPVGSLRARVYQTGFNGPADHETFLRDYQTDCSCLQTKVLSGTGALSSVYATADTFTELETDNTFAGFTGYKGLRFPPVAAVDLFGRLSNASRTTLSSGAPFPSR
jgi:hypothetical protein